MDTILERTDRTRLKDMTNLLKMIIDELGVVCGLIDFANNLK